MKCQLSINENNTRVRLVQEYSSIQVLSSYFIVRFTVQIRVEKYCLLLGLLSIRLIIIIIIIIIIYNLP